MRADTPGVQRLPDGPDRDDVLAALYAWPDADAQDTPDDRDTPDAGDPQGPRDAPATPDRPPPPRPTVRANMITSLDGGAAVDGRSGGLGNEADRHLFALLRDLADVILVGSGTVRAEQYAGVELDAQRRARRRRWGLPATPPPIAVVTGRGLDPTLPLFTDTQTPPIVITARSAAGKVPPTAEPLIAGEDTVDLVTAVRGLADRGYRRIHCEGGPALFGQLIADGLLDECCLTIAPLLLGSAATRLLPTDLPDPAAWTPASIRIGGAHLFARYSRAGGSGSAGGSG